MIPFQKVFTLFIRTFSKPLIAYAKKQQHLNKLPFFRWFFVRVGRKYHALEHWLNHKILKTTHKKQLTDLKEEILLEKGIEGFFEIVFYSIVFGIPLYELHKSTVSAEKKEIKLSEQIYVMEKKMEQVKFNLRQVLFISKKKSRNQKRIMSDRAVKMEDVVKERQSRRDRWIYEMVGLPEEEKEQVIDNTEQIGKEDNLIAKSEELITQNSEDSNSNITTQPSLEPNQELSPQSSVPSP